MNMEYGISQSIVVRISDANCSASVGMYRPISFRRHRVPVSASTPGLTDYTAQHTLVAIVRELDLGSAIRPRLRSASECDVTTV